MLQAWLIIAHNEFSILQLLIDALDAPGCDFFIHIDKKVEELPELRVTHGRLLVIKDRVDVRWGTVSQIETELKLMEYALQKGRYSHYHIISGTHLPLKSIDEITDFFNTHAGEEVMHFWPKDGGDADFKLRRYHFPIRGFKSPDRFRRSMCQFTWKCVLKVQKMLGIRHLQDERFYKTDNWLSLTEDAVRYLITREKEILRKYRWSLCGDEYFVASELKAVGDRFRITDYPRLLLVDFRVDSPRALSLNEYPALCESGYLFARKFSSQA
jgi:hypothetical protein